MAVELKWAGDDMPEGFTPVRVIAGREEMSALYEYDILVRTTKPCSEVRVCLGKRVQLEIMLGTTCIQTVHGIVMEIESTRQYVDSADISSAVSGEAWYKWTIRPAFAKACYSLNRLVYDEEKLSSGGKTAGEQLLDMLVQRWDCPMQIETKTKEILATKKFIQFVQNDESDYNFFCRLLAHWGLGYMWKMADAKEELHVIDVSRSMDDVSNTAGEKVLLEPVSSKASMWTVRYGCSSVPNAVQNYNADLSKAVDVKINLYDMEAAQFLSEHGDKHTCHGKYVDQKVVVGQKAGWRTSDCQLDSALEYCITKAAIATKTYIDSTGKKAQRLEGTVDGREWPASDRGIGIVPRPVAVNERPDISGEALIRMEEPGRARSRTFMVIVVDVSACKHAEAQNSNLCKVREISSLGTGANLQLENTLWVEMGSPFADKNSGLLARPRVGNVLFCLDRGDMSIPIVLTAMFRNGVEPHYAKWRLLDRHSRTNEQEGATSTTDKVETDYSAVTLRNRVHVPPRKYNDQAAITPEEDKEITADQSLDVMRPLSVEKLAASPMPFSQIQIVSLDNGVKPVEHDEHLTNTYCASGVTETVLGFITDANLSSGYSMSSVAQAVDSGRNVPVSRPHFEGINLYSGKDLMIQSADHQIVNAGGEIVLTAAQGITLRVGKSSIRITEAGVEIMSGCGKVLNPGAYPPYNQKGDAQAAHLMSTLGGRIWVDVSGVNTKGPYISNTALNLFSASTMLGSTLKISDFSAKLFSPHTTIVGGAAICDTIVSGVSQALAEGKDIAMTCAGASFVYSDALVDGWKKYGYDATFIASGSMTAVTKEVCSFVGGIATAASRFKDLFSITGSMIKMEPSAMTLSSSQLWNYQNHLTEVNTPISGFVAMGERAGDSAVIQNLLLDVEALGTMLSNGFSQLHNNTLGGDGKDETDLYTKKIPDAKPPCNTGKTKGSKAANTAFSVIGSFGMCLTTALKLTGKLGTAVQKLASILYLGKRDMLLGMEKVDQLKKAQTHLQNAVSALDTKLLSVSKDENVATAHKNTMNDNTKTMSMVHKCIAVQRQMVANNSKALSTKEQNVMIDTQLSIKTSNKTLTNSQGQNVII